MSLLGGACCQLSSMTKGEIVGQSESSMVCLSLVLSLMSTESLIEVLMSTKSLTVVFVCGLVPGLGPLWSPSCVLDCVLSGRPFPQVQAQV